MYNYPHMIFEEQVSRLPDHYPWTDKLIHAMWKNPWNAGDFDFSSDKQDFLTQMNDQQREMVTRVVSAIGQIEVQVKRYWARVGDNLPHPSIIDMGLVFAGVEVIHNKAYEKLLKELGLEGVFEENLKLDVVKNRVKYLGKHSHKYHAESKRQFLYSLILFTLFVENVSLFSQFYVISWLNKDKNWLKDTAQQVLYTRQEETIHALGGMKLIEEIRREHPEIFDDALTETIIKEAIAAFEAESKIVDWMLAGYEDSNLSPAILKEYIKARINDSLDAIGFPKPFELNEELLTKTEWADEQTMANMMTDFFDSRPVEYERRKLTEAEVFRD